ncbi:MAG: DMT family transporter [Rhodobacteraceae bacterium]|jgi:drug/metabolite transporter (DMT)-like permease|nr:DMT family transporter [Paracoccaceae bacterium]
MTDNQRGALLMMASMAAFTINDTFVKLLGSIMPLGQILFVRGGFVLIALVALAWRMGALRWSHSVKDWSLIISRGVAEAAAAFFFLEALIHMPLANVTALLQLLPLTVALGGAVFLAEPIGWRRVSAILVGFVGMLLIVRPDGDGFGTYTIYALIAVVAVTFRDLAIRRMSKTVPSLLVTLIGAVCVWVFSWFMMLNTTLVPMGPHEWALILGAVVFVCFGYVFSVLVMRVGDLSVVALFRYSGLIWALIMGYLVFGDWPKTLTLIGALLIVGSGLYTMMREQWHNRRSKSV